MLFGESFSLAVLVFPDIMNCDASCQRAACRVLTWGTEHHFEVHVMILLQIYIFASPEGCEEGGVEVTLELLTKQKPR